MRKPLPTSVVHQSELTRVKCLSQVSAAPPASRPSRQSNEDRQGPESPK